MSKHLVTAIGLIASLGVIALGVFLVALPLYFQAVGVDAQTAAVVNTNAIYQAQVDHLSEQEQNLDQIDANVDQLRAQIPSTGQLDDVFEVVGRAVQASGVSLVAVTAGEQVAFTPRTDTTGRGVTAPATATESTDETADAASETVEATTGANVADGEGRQQVEMTIGATAADMTQATAFLDALRAGPRLLSSMTAITSQSGEGSVSVQISALTYVDAEG